MTTAPRRTLVQRLLALQRGGEVVASAPSINHATQNAADQLVQGYGAALVRIWRVNEQSNELILSGRAHLPFISADTPQRIDIASGRAGRIAGGRRAEVTSLLVQSPALHDPADPQRYGLCAYAGFPLMFEQRLYGVLELFLIEPCLAEEIEPLATFANQLSAVVARLNVSEEATTEMARASIALKLDRLIDATDDIDTILQTTAEEIGRNLKLDACLVQLWSLNNEEAPPSLEDWMPFAHQYTGSDLGQDLMFTPSLQTRNLRPQGIAREILTGREPILIEDAKNNPHGLVRQLAARRELTAACIVPITHRHTVIGAIELYRCRNPHSWSRGEVIEARQAASAIAIAAHMAQLEFSGRKSALVDAMFNEAFGPTSFDKALNAAATVLRSLAKTEFAGLYYGDITENSNTVGLRLHGPDREKRFIEIKLSAVPDLRRSMETGQPYAVGNTGQHPSTQFLAEQEIGALLAAPLRNADGTIGFAIIAQKRNRKWNTSDVFGLSMLVEPLGSALSKAKYAVVPLPPPNNEPEPKAEVDHLIEELRISELGERIFAAVREAVDIEGVLKVAVEELGQSLKASRCYAVAMPAEQPFTGVLLHGSVTAEYDRGGIEPLPQLPIEGSVVEEVTRSLSSLSINDCTMSSLTRDDAERLSEFGIRALLLAPVVFNNQVNGLIAVHDDSPRQWSPQNMTLLTRAADAVAIGLKYLTLAGGAEYLAERATAVRYSLRRIYSNLNFDSILAETTRSAALIFNVDQACMFQVGSVMICIHEAGSEEFPGPMALGMQLETEGNPLLGQSNGAPAVLNHIGADLYPVLADELATLKVKSAMAAKLTNGDEELLLSIHQCDKPRRWTSEEISIFRDLVQNAQTALDASRRIAEAEQKSLLIETEPPAVIAIDHGPGPSTNGKLSNEDLSRLNKDLEEMLYAASHDMQSPLLSIDGYLSHLERELVGHPSARTSQYLERIKANTTQLQKLISSLLDVSRLRKQADISQKVDCAEVVKSLKQELQPRLDGIGGQIEIVSELPTVKGSRLQLTRVFSNLVNNAINYRDQSRPLKITINHRSQSEETEFRVNDNGLGIKSSEFDRIFQPLTRLEVNQSEGTGMGLYIVKQILGNHGGRIWVESQEGVGTTFVFTLPAHSHNGSTAFRRVTPHRHA